MPPLDIFCTFGPRDSFFFKTDTNHWSGYRLPKFIHGVDLLETFINTAQMVVWNTRGLCCQCTDESGDYVIRGYDFSPKLSNFLARHHSDPVRLVFGQGGSWFAWSLCYSKPIFSSDCMRSVRNNATDIRKRYMTLRTVALGPESNYVIVWQDDSVSYQLEDDYAALRGVIEGGGQITHVTLNPHQFGDFFIYSEKSNTAMLQGSEKFGESVQNKLSRRGVKTVILSRPEEDASRTNGERTTAILRPTTPPHPPLI